jgi:hypothetical protein
MRRHADWYFENHEPSDLTPDRQLFAEFFAYLSLWYGTLWVALDGWRQLGLPNERLAAVLGDGRFGLLKGFRNVTFHFLRDYVEPRHMAFIMAEDSVLWVSDAHDALSTALLDALRPYLPD